MRGGALAAAPKPFPRAAACRAFPRGTRGRRRAAAVARAQAMARAAGGGWQHGHRAGGRGCAGWRRRAQRDLQGTKLSVEGIKVWGHGR